MSLKSKRLERGMSRGELAKKSGVHYVKIHQIETGKIDPANITLKTAARLADALRIDPRDLLKEGE